MDAKICVASAWICSGVSIHAPVMDANVSSSILFLFNSVSIHAPVMDANEQWATQTKQIMFQSTRP